MSNEVTTQNNEGPGVGAAAVEAPTAPEVSLADVEMPARDDDVQDRSADIQLDHRAVEPVSSESAEPGLVEPESDMAPQIGQHHAGADVSIDQGLVETSADHAFNDLPSAVLYMNGRMGTLEGRLGARLDNLDDRVTDLENASLEDGYEIPKSKSCGDYRLRRTSDRAARRAGCR